VQWVPRLDQILHTLNVDEDMTQAEVYIDTSLQTAKATGVDQDAIM
jgi:hypothetical protein